MGNGNRREGTESEAAFAISDPVEIKLLFLHPEGRFYFIVEEYLFKAGEII